MRTAQSFGAGAALGVAAPVAAKAVTTKLVPPVRNFAQGQVDAAQELFGGNPMPYRNVTPEEVAAANRVRRAQQGIDDPFALTEEDRLLADSAMAKMGTKDSVDLDNLITDRSIYSQRQRELEGGYAKVPSGKRDPAPDLDPNQKDFVNMWAETLQSMDADNGVAINHAKGTRSSSNSPFYRETYAKTGKPPTKAEWFAEARRQLESGKADPDAVAEYKNLSENARLANDPFSPESLEKLDDDLNKQTTEPAVPSQTQPVQKSAAPPEQSAGQNLSDSLENSVAPTKPSRLANRTVPNSEEVSPELQKMVKEEDVRYDPTTNEGRIAEAERTLAGKSDDDNFQQVMEGLKKGAEDQHGQAKVTAIQYAKKLDEAGDEKSLFKATEVYHELSQRLSEAGQEIQAAALLAARTPQGLYYKAQRDLEKALGKKNVTDAMRKELKGYIDAVKKAEKGSPEEAMARDNVQYFVAKNTPTDRADKIVNLWRSGLLTAPTTTGGAAIGNAANTLTRKLWVNPAATIADMAMSIGTGQRSQTLAKSGEWGKGFKAGAKNATSKQYWKTGYDPQNPHATADSMGTHSRTINYGDGMLGQATGAYVNGVYKLMGAADQPFRYGANKEILSSMAKAEAKNKGLKGKEARAYVQSQIDNPSDELKFAAQEESLGSTFQNKTVLASAAQSLKAGLRQRNHPKAAAVVDFLMPFTGVPSAVADRAIRHSGIKAGVEVTKALVGAVKGKPFSPADQRKLAQYIGEGTIGLPIVAAGYALAQNDMFNGAFPSDPKERELWKAEGRQENSVKVGDRWYSMNYIQPFGVLLGLGAGIAQTKGEDNQVAAIDDYVKNGAMSAMKSFMGQSYLEGLQAPLEAFNDPEQNLDRYIASAASSTVPNLLRSFANATDDVQREAKGAVAGVKGAIPGLRQTLPEKLDMFGGQVERKDNFANMFLNPTKPSKTRNDDVATKELRRLYNGDEAIMPTKAKKDAFKGVSLTREQMREIDTQAGQAMKIAYAETINSPQYKALSDEDKRKSLVRINDTVYGALKAKYGADNGLAEAKYDTKQKRYLKDGSIPTAKASDTDDSDAKTYAEKYQDALDDYKKDSASWSSVKKTKKDRELQQLKVQKDFDDDTVALYGMSKSQVYDLVSSDKNGKALAKKMLAYGDALVDAGLAETNKFRDKNGGEALKPKEKSGGSGGRKRTDFSLFSGNANPVAYDKKLRQLLAQAKLA